MIHTSILVLVPGLRYNNIALFPGAQTCRPGRVGPVSKLLSGMSLIGRWFLCTNRSRPHAGPAINYYGCCILRANCSSWSPLANVAP